MLPYAETLMPRRKNQRLAPYQRVSIFEESVSDRTDGGYLKNLGTTLRQSAALVRQPFRNAVGEKRPPGGLEVLSGRFSLGPFPGLKAPAILFSPFGRPDLTDNVYYRWSSG